MTQRESEILQIIREDPSIPQNDIAKRLDISRSAVSVYLNTMYKKGILRGRGYIINEGCSPVLIGPSHVDIRSVCRVGPDENSRLYTSTRTQVAYGGPIKNIAECLICLGVVPKAIFSIASDSLGDSFLVSCKQLGFDVSGSIIVQGATTPVYIELMGEDSLVITSSFAQDNLASHITPTHLFSQRSTLKDANTIVIHDSIPGDSVMTLPTLSPKAHLMLIASQLHYTIRQVPQFPVFHTAVLHYSIAFGIAYKSDLNSQSIVYSNLDLLPVVNRIVGLGLSNFYMMLDQFSICYCDGTQLITHRSENPFPNEASFEIYRYCRDTFTAILTYAIDNQLPPTEVLDVMAASRNLICASSTDVSFDITISRLRDGAAALSPTLKTVML